MYIPVTYEQDFDDLWMHLKSKYPEKLFNLDGVGEQLDMSKFSKKFFSSAVTSDASIDANANVDDMSVIAYEKELPKPFLKMNSYYILWKELKKLYGRPFADSVVEMQLTGDIYINDMHGIGAGKPYCFNYSTYDILTKGLPMVKKVKCEPPKYLYSFKSQLEQFVTIASNSTLGASGTADMLIMMAYYMKNMLNTLSDAHFTFADEDAVWRYVRENLVSFVYTINQPMRGNQSPFTNLSVYDDNFLDKLCADYIFPDGSTPDKEIVKKLQNIYLDIMNEELQRTPLTFPVTTACFSIDKDNNIQDEAFLHNIAQKNLQWGFINMYAGSSSTLSSCCRLRSEQQSEYFNSFGSGSSKIGSLGVCTINFPRLAIQYPLEEDFMEKLEEMVGVCAKVNNAKRHIVQKRINNGNEPLYKYEFMELSKQYSTCGVNGFYETIKLLGYDILTEEGQALALRILDKINDTNKIYQNKYKMPHNVEQVPGENLSIKLAEKDKLMGYQNEYNLYSNQFIPLIANADLFDRIKLQGLFDSHFSGGSICHLNVETKITDVKDMEDLIRVAAKKGVVYFAINYVLSQCANGHMSVTNGDKCLVCGEPITDKYTRVVGKVC